MSFVSFQKTEKTEFLSFFYKYCMHVLTAPLLANTAHDKTSKGELSTSTVLHTHRNGDPHVGVFFLSELQEGSTKVNPVCPGEHPADVHTGSRVFTEQLHQVCM